MRRRLRRRESDIVKKEETPAAEESDIITKEETPVAEERDTITKGGNAGGGGE